MDYQFENLLDERFQEFCSVLVNKKYENVQSFPIGQPDGGRDTLAYINQNKDFIVFQVKYVRNPKKIVDPHKWLLKILEEELPKIDNLIPKGAVKYVLITNVAGTAHLDSGSIDKVNKLLEDKISIPSICWWRDDMSRIIEEDPLLKWSFPEILNGQDVLNNILFDYVNKDKERIQSIVNAFLKDQYEIDNEVKFKQIDLQNNTLDLYVDVPIRIKKFDVKNKPLKKTIEKCLYSEQYYLDNDTYYYHDEKKSTKAAEFILNSLVQKNIERILLEGGPGQGKSTISQFICQINRVKLLNKTTDINKIPEKLKNSPVRLPIKIDLRHIASWIRNKNPYEGTLSDEKFKLINNSSLESFLQGNFIYHSKLDTITVEDIIQIFKLSSVLIVFDGFDEIADLKLRQDVIDLINRGISRLSENSRSLQVLITSRPAAFTENVDFPITLYPRFELADLDLAVTNEYVEKWTKVNKLDDREKRFIMKLVNDKLEQAHIKELTKSPMQLAIFLSLIRTRGESLPNKRTALYDSYIELFFNREAEKNSVIRDKRELIINIHEYLGWLLHSEAELLNTNGIIAIDELKRKVEQFLKYEGHDTGITNQLFDVLKERVCALVSRIQGTFEFEVQPLREYFCAKFLYNTAPYANYGKGDVKGTKTDRFRAILRNVYWQNVTRFYAGCFDKGELPMIIIELKELINDKRFKNTSYAKLITSQLLSDWVFTQYPNLLKDVIAIIIDGLSKGELVNQDKYNLFSSAINIPNDCGRKELVDRAFELLLDFPKLDYANQLISLLINNPENNFERWLNNYDKLTSDKWERWFFYGYKMQVLHNLKSDFIEKFFLDDSIPNKNYIYKFLVNGNALKKEVLTPEKKQILLDIILDRKLYLHGNDNEDGLTQLNFMSLLLNSNFIQYSLTNNNDNTSLEVFFRRNLPEEIDGNFDKVDKKILEFKNEIKPFLDALIKELKEETKNWIILFDGLTKYFGEKDNIKDLCINLIVNLKLKNNKFSGNDYLFQTQDSLFNRLKNAKQKSGNSAYWRSNFEEYKNTSNQSYLIIIFILFTTPKTIINLIGDLENIVKNISEEEFNLLINHLYMFEGLNRFPKKYENEIELLLNTENTSDRLISLLSVRFSEKKRYHFLTNKIKSDININVINSQLLQSLCIDMIRSNNIILLDQIKEKYALISSSSDPLEYIRYTNKVDIKHMSIQIAEKIMEEAEKYPQLLVSLAESKCFEDLCTRMIQVGKICEKEEWFNYN